MIQLRPMVRGSRTVRLVDGATLLVRPIRPADKARLTAGLERLSPTSRYRRFLTPIDHLSAAQLRYLTEVDHHTHEALVALDRATGEGVGVARFVCAADDPASAELAVAVRDDWHARGVGTALLALLIDRARAEGVERFNGLILADNRPMFELLAEFADARVVDRSSGAVEVEFELPDAGLGHRLPALLRAAARGELRLARRDGDGTR